MSDFIRIKKVWEDVGFIQVLIECQSSCININNKYYIDNETIKALISGIKNFLFDNKAYFLWQSGEIGNSTAACISFEFTYRDKNGHILIDVFMEIDDGSSYEKHNCCFFINTEFGLLEQFSIHLHKILDGEIGTSVFLGSANQSGDG